MSARFREVSPSAGVDEDQQGMIIPAGGSNTVLLEGGKGFKLTTDIPKLQIDIDKAPVSSATVARPAIKIRLTDKSKARSTGTVTAKNHKTREVVVLRVTVLPPKPISLAVKPVLIRMTGILTGAFAIHCKQPFDDIPGMVKTMNSIWTPQANVVFNFVQSTTRAEIDDPNPTVIFPTVVEQFNGMKEPGVDFTMFLVEKAGDLRPGASRVKEVAGVSDPDHGIALISDSRKLQPDVMAHEAGHLLGWTGPHSGNPKHLMYDGGSLPDTISYNQAVNIFNK